MSWDYAKDDRNDNKVLENYKLGKAAEKAIIESQLEITPKYIIIQAVNTQKNVKE